ncbi:MAG: pseudouridine synthase [bacterium]|nr:pseudouridine synthase [bacterium]
METIRLNKYIAQTGYCSRRQADELIASGKVFLNDRKVTEQGVKMDPQTDQVRVKDGPTLQIKQEKVLLMMNKPKGYICTKRDRHATRTVYELLPQAYQHLNSIGRLDKDSEGLLLFTNDGELANQLTHPKFAKEKVYHVSIRGTVDEKDLDRMRKGMRLLDYSVSPAVVQEISHDEKKNRTVLEITIKEGKNRQIRNMFLALKKQVKKLVRLRAGKYELGKLKTGEWQKIRM